MSKEGNHTRSNITLWFALVFLFEVIDYNKITAQMFWPVLGASFLPGKFSMSSLC